MDEQNKINKWISCRVRLPKKNQDVQIKFDNGLIFIGGIDDDGWYVGSKGIMFDSFDMLLLPDDIHEIISWREIPV